MVRNKERIVFLKQLDAFIRALKKNPSTEEVDNLYRGNSHLSRLRRANLSIYLSIMQERAPRFLLVGEAPGYKGCKLTGVPFSCEYLLMENEAHPVYGLKHAYQCLNSHESYEKERSAIMVWEELNKYEEIPLIWNIFPYHPHHKKEKYTNRTPRVSEIRAGQMYIKKLVDMFPITHIAAVGRKAYQGLAEMELQDISVQYLRHPSYGGKRDFVAGLATFMANASQ